MRRGRRETAVPGAQGSKISRWRDRAGWQTVRVTSTYLAAIDQGTTSTRCIVFDVDGRIVALDQREHRQGYPRPGWVEHDAAQIWPHLQAGTRGAPDPARPSPAAIAPGGLPHHREAPP